ncbi:MAG TPA: hypothetical protein VMW76_00550 [Bacteroidales bacterium]|nr:hypothetical protein [Bacteroidales bacterium]
MDKIERILITPGIFLIVLICIFPPFFAVKLSERETIHDGIGYFPLWNIPDSEIAFERLTDLEYNPESVQDIEDYVIGFNKVLFIFNIIVVTLSTFLIIILRRKLIRKKS